jgi:hypothetical protein
LIISTKSLLCVFFTAPESTTLKVQPVTLKADLAEGAFNVEALGRDAQAVVKLVQALDVGADKARFDMARVAAYLEKHQEQPELLDPYLADILTPLVARMRQHANNDVLEDVSKVLYVLVKVRGYKTVGE